MLPSVSVVVAAVLALLLLSVSVSGQNAASAYSSFTSLSSAVVWGGRTKTGLAFVTRSLNVTLNGVTVVTPIGSTAVMSVRRSHLSLFRPARRHTDLPKDPSLIVFALSVVLLVT